MPLTALRTVSKPQNGVGAFILQCKRLDFHYCDWAGSSRGMNAFLKGTLPAFAKANPQIEITVSPRPTKHPVIRGHYINGREKAICVRKMDPNQILQKAELLRDASGEKLRREIRRPVKSLNESVRGIWSPFHAPIEEKRWKI
ncbi:39S ribosomal protein L51, mitochondrial [Coniosporium apollinis]|uniref:Large ribosomal subunit protein mL43 n=2 Tax=Coniosporium TaxID=2810619 RepID=A0ABQ9NZZ9_9PEZI|nr:39S ribosomal protein L51, mitochondrial [Cladosporium sp. JES 115]KAJ9665722.1 39S ribosomal protein L51, mitochondrial [Coniosporium apollinis]